MFEILRKFAKADKGEKRRSLQENARQVLKRDHLLARLDSPGATDGVHLPGEAEPLPEQSTATGPANPAEFPPPSGFETELKRLARLMDFSDC